MDWDKSGIQGNGERAGKRNKERIKMEIIDRLKEAYLDGARSVYLRTRALMAFSRYMKSKNLDYVKIQKEYDSRLDSRAETIESQYRTESLIARIAYKVGKTQIRKRPNFRNLEAKTMRIWNSRFEPTTINLRLIK